MGAEDATTRGLPGGPPVHPMPGRLTGKRGVYHCESRLGGGAFGQVYLARSENAEPSVPARLAIKLFGVPQDGQAREILCRELASLMRMQHDRIPRVWDWSDAGSEKNFIAMEHYPNGNLTALIQQGPLPQARVLELLVDLLTAILEAHRNSVLHLDIKPSNVLLDAGGRFALGDFGISQALNVRGDNYPVGLGTLGYNAPEQLRYVQAAAPGPLLDFFDVRTDLFSVGATVWSALVGVDLSRKGVLAGLPSPEAGYGLPDPRKLVPVDAALAELVMEMLQIHPSRRPGGAAEALARADALRKGVAPPAPEFKRPRPDRLEAVKVLEGLIDPVLVSYSRSAAVLESVVQFEPGYIIAREGDNSHFALMLLRGTVDFLRDGHVINSIAQEGSCIGEVSTLTDGHRTATMVARDVVWAVVLAQAELEGMIARHPEIGLRIMKSLAGHVVREREMKRAR